MKIRLRESYRPRPIRFLEEWPVEGYRLKVYGITRGDPVPAGALLDAAKAVVQRHLSERPTRHTTYGVGFLGVHQGRGANQIFLDRWINENELHHVVYVSHPERPTELTRAPDDYNSVCLWDLALQAFEREAWLRCVLANPEGPDLEAYLRERFVGEV